MRAKRLPRVCSAVRLIKVAESKREWGDETHASERKNVLHIMCVYFSLSHPTIFWVLCLFLCLSLFRQICIKKYIDWQFLHAFKAYVSLKKRTWIYECWFFLTLSPLSLIPGKHIACMYAEVYWMNTFYESIKLYTLFIALLSLRVDFGLPFRSHEYSSGRCLYGVRQPSEISNSQPNNGDIVERANQSPDLRENCAYEMVERVEPHRHLVMVKSLRSGGDEVAEAAGSGEKLQANV